MMENSRTLPVVLKGALFGGVIGIIFGLLEVFFALALLEDFFRWGISRHYVVHWGSAFSILLFDLLAGVAWGVLGGLALLGFGRREGPYCHVEPFLCFWNALLPAVGYPTFYLFTTFLSPRSRYAPYWLPITLVWIAAAMGIAALLYYLFAHRYRAAASKSLNLFLAVILSGLVLGGAYLNSSPGSSIVSPLSLLKNLGLTVLALAALKMVLIAASRTALRRSLAAVVTAAMVLGALYVGASTSLPARRGSLAWADTANPAERPNVVLVVLDTQRADRLGFMNSAIKSSPNLDQLAADSVIYERCIAPSSWTLPTHASLFTGLYPTVHGADYRLKGGISPTNPDRAYQIQTAWPLHGRTTLAEVLRENDYATGSVCGNCGYLAPAFGLSAGFEFHDSRMPQPFRMRPVADLALHPMRKSLPYDYIEAGYTVEPQRKTYRSARSVADVSRWWLSQLSKENRRPFFLFMNYCDPHAPYIPPYEFDRFPGKVPGMGMPSAVDVAEGKREIDSIMRGHLLSAYDGEISYMDHHLGRVIQDLKDRGDYDKSLIIVTSDHGEFFGEHGRLGHGGDLYEPVVHAPLIVKYPGSREKGRKDELVSLVDIMPTVLEEVGIPIPQGLDGRPLSEGDRSVIAELYPSTDRVRAFGEEANRRQLAWYEGPWKLVQTAYPDGREDFELYNVRSDPGEEMNLYESEPEVTALLEPKMKAWFESAENRRLPDDGRTAPKIHKALEEGMKGIGYTH